jgi:hypothetical protein
MAKIKKKLTPAQKRAKAERRKLYQTVFINGKQVKVKRPPMVDGMPIDEYIAKNAHPLWLHQQEMWELIPGEESDMKSEWPNESKSGEPETDERDSELPF